MFYFYKLKKDISKETISYYGYEKIDRDAVFLSEHKLSPGYSYYDVTGNVYLRYEHFDLATKEEADAFLAEQAKYTIEDYVNMKSTRVGLGTTGVTIHGVHVVRNNIPCHASFTGKGVTAAATYTNHNRKYVTDENMDAFKELIHWIMNKSPWLHCIARSWDILSATERTDRAMNGAVPIDIDAPANEVASFCVAMRVVTEHSWTLNTYKKLRSMRINVPLSFLLSGHIVHEEEGEFRYFRNTDWHHFMRYNQNINHLCKFFKIGFFSDKRDKLPFKQGRYSYIANQITRDETNSVEELANKCLKTEGKGFDSRTVFDYTKFIGTFKKEWNNA